MRARRKDIVIAGVIIALCAWAVWRQIDADPLEPYEKSFVRTIGVGEALDPDVTLVDIGGERRRVGDWFGSKATVLYSWSTTCPCIPVCEERLREVYVEYGPEEGVTWIGVAGEPTDTGSGVLHHMASIRAFYKMLLDPYQRLCTRLGFDRAAVVAVLDADGYLRFRGNVTDDLKKPLRNYLAEVLPAVVAGERPPVAETELSYGCEFSAPGPCPDEELLPPPESGAP